MLGSFAQVAAPCSIFIFRDVLGDQDAARIHGGGAQILQFIDKTKKREREKEDLLRITLPGTELDLLHLQGTLPANGQFPSFIY